VQRAVGDWQLAIGNWQLAIGLKLGISEPSIFGTKSEKAARFSAAFFCLTANR
jgi:hypothetical protein